MAEFIPIGKPANEAERLGFRLLRDRLPEHYVVLGNFDLHLPRRRNSLEYDAVVIGEYGFFPVEIKGWSGRIKAGDRHWMVPWGRVSSPLAHLQKKTKALAHHIRNVLPELNVLTYSPGIFFPRGDVHLECRPAMRRYIIEPDRLYEFFVKLDLMREQGPGPLRSPEQIQAVANAIVERAEPSASLVDLPFYEIEAELERKDRAYREFVGTHRHLKSRPKVRIKAYTLDWLASQGSIQSEKSRFLRDMEALESMTKNPYVVQSYEMHPNVDEEAGFYVVSEWVGPMTLEIYLEEVQERSPEEREYLAAHLVRAVDSIHKDGTIHCNLQPRSIFLTGEDESGGGIPLKIADFDYAQIADFDTTVEWEEEDGVEWYRPPRDWSLGEGDRGIDLFAVGVMLFRLLSGEAYFRSESEHRAPEFTWAKREPLLRDSPWKEAVQGLLSPESDRRSDAMEIALRQAREILG